MHAQLATACSFGLLLLSVVACTQQAIATDNKLELPGLSDEAPHAHARVILQAARPSSPNATISSTAVAPVSNPTILQTADATFRLEGNDVLPFVNATAAVFQQALQAVFSNYSYASFQYQSFMVLKCHTSHRYDMRLNTVVHGKALSKDCQHS